MATATYIPIASQTLGSAAASITFSSIPGTYTDLRLVLNNLTQSNGPGAIKLLFNSDSGSNYSNTSLSANGTSAASGNNTSYPGILMAQQTFTTTYPLMATMDVFSYTGSTNKTCLTTVALDQNGGTGYVELAVQLWRSTAAITSISMTQTGSVNNFNAGTIATLFGI